MTAVWSVHLFIRLRVGPSLLTATSCRSPKDIYCFLIWHKGRHRGLWGRSLGPSCFPCVCVSCLPGLQLPPAGQKRACDANWQLQTVSRSECECEWSFVFLWPAINWQLVHAVALPWHPRTAGIGCTQPPATLSAGEAVCLYSTSAFSFIYLFYVACTNKENFSR